MAKLKEDRDEQLGDIETQLELVRVIKENLEQKRNEEAIEKEENKEQMSNDDEAEVGDQIVHEDNISKHLGFQKKIEQIVEMMVEKLRQKGKTVDSFTTPQILVLTQDTLVVTALYKALRNKFSFVKNPRKVVKGEKQKPEDIEVRVHKLFARHIPLKEHQDLL